MGSKEYFEDMKSIVRNLPQEETVELVDSARQSALRAERAPEYGKLKDSAGEERGKKAISFSAFRVAESSKDTVDIVNNHHKNKDR